jgi:hypothetical protein
MMLIVNIFKTSKNTHLNLLLKEIIMNLSIELVEVDSEYQFTVNNDPIIKINKDSVKDKEVAQDICDGLIFTLNAGIEVGKQVEKNETKTKVITLEEAEQLAWNTFIPVPMPNNFQSLEDDLRFEFLAEHMFGIFSDVSPTDLEGTMKHLANDIVKAQIA